MPITEIKYKKLVNLGNYENESIEATMTVCELENPVVAREELVKFVNEQLDTLANEREMKRKETARQIEEERKNEKLEQEKLKNTISKVKYLNIDAGVRYWNDSCINGNEDADDDPKMPFAIKIKDSKWRWRPIIEVEQGKIVNWPTYIYAAINYKVCDDFYCAGVDENGVVLAEYGGYVPTIMSPDGGGWGDYIIMHVNAEGIIENWDKELMSGLFGVEGLV